MLMHLHLKGFSKPENDSLNNKSKFPIQISGSSLIFESGYNPPVFPGLEQNGFYNRVYFNPKIQVLGLEFQSTVSFGNESFQMGRFNDVLNLKFNKVSKYDILKQSSKVKYLNNLTHEIDSLNELVNNAEQTYNRLNEGYQNPNYQESINNAKAIVERCKSDSLFNAHYPEKKWNANQVLKADSIHLYEVGKLDSIKTQLHKILEIKKKVKSLSELTNRSFEPSQLQQKLPSSNGVFKDYSLNRLEIGDHQPEFSKLALSQVSNRGILLDIGKGNFHMALTVGKMSSFGTNSTAFSRNGNLLGLQIGHKKDNVYRIDYVFVKAENGEDNKENKNLNQSICTGFTGNFILFKNHTISGEWMVSGYKFTKTENTLNTAINSIPSFGENQSYLVNYEGLFPKHKLAIGAITKKDGYSFYSLGSPFNRPGTRTFDVHFKKDLFKNLIQFGSSFIKESNEANNFKTNSLKYFVMFKQRKFNLRIEHISLQTKLGLLNSGSFKTNILILTSVMNGKLLNKPSILVINSIYNQSSRFNEADSNTRSSFNFSVSEIWKISKSIDLNLRYSRNTNLNADSNSSFSYSIKCNKRFKKYQLGIYGDYMQIQARESRLNSGFSFQGNLFKQLQVLVNIGAIYIQMKNDRSGNWYSSGLIRLTYTI
jgi:hypothetical protein